MSQKDIGSVPRILVVTDYSALSLGLETLFTSAHPHLELKGAISELDSLAGAMDSGANIIVTDLDSALGQECVSLLGQINQISIVALIGTATEDQIDAAVLKGLKGVVQKRAGNDVLLKAVLAVHQGELWLDRLVTSRILRGLRGVTAGEVKSVSILDRLTKREKVICKIVIKRAGAPSRSIANDLHISEHTLRNHLTAIYSKLGVSSRLELLVLAHQETPQINEDIGFSDL